MHNIIVCANCKKGILDLFYEKHKQHCLAMTEIIEG